MQVNDNSYLNQPTYEVWKEIKDYPGYLISNHGRVKSLKTNRILKQNLTSNGYPMVGICQKGKHKSLMIHRLIAIHFLPNPNNKRVVNHINGIKTDNRIENLEWCTYSENSLHAQKHGLTPPPPSWKGRFGDNHNRSKAVIEYDLKGNELRRFGSASEAGRALGVHVTTVAVAIKNNSVSRVTGTKFRYE